MKIDWYCFFNKKDRESTEREEREQIFVNQLIFIDDKLYINFNYVEKRQVELFAQGFIQGLDFSNVYYSIKRHYLFKDEQDSVIDKHAKRLKERNKNKDKNRNEPPIKIDDYTLLRKDCESGIFLNVDHCIFINDVEVEVDLSAEKEHNSPENIDSFDMHERIIHEARNTFEFMGFKVEVSAHYEPIESKEVIRQHHKQI